MPDRIFMPLMGLIALVLIAFALVWPQGQGDRSWGPFGHTPVQQTPEMKAKIKREQEAAARRDAAARKAIEAAGQAPPVLEEPAPASPSQVPPDQVPQ